MTSTPTSTAFSLPPGETPLGIRQPLLSPPPLGQSLLQPKFFTPLGVRSLTVLDSALLTPEQSSSEEEERSPFQDSPFFEPLEPARSPEIKSQAAQPTLQTRRFDSAVEPAVESAGESTSAVSAGLTERAEIGVKPFIHEDPSATWANDDPSGQAIAQTSADPIPGTAQPVSAPTVQRSPAEPVAASVTEGLSESSDPSLAESALPTPIAESGLPVPESPVPSISESSAPSLRRLVTEESAQPTSVVPESPLQSISESASPISESASPALEATEPSIPEASVPSISRFISEEAEEPASTVAESPLQSISEASVPSINRLAVDDATQAEQTLTESVAQPSATNPPVSLAPAPLDLPPASSPAPTTVKESAERSPAFESNLQPTSEDTLRRSPTEPEIQQPDLQALETQPIAEPTAPAEVGSEESVGLVTPQADDQESSSEVVQAKAENSPSETLEDFGGDRSSGDVVETISQEPLSEGERQLPETQIDQASGNIVEHQPAIQTKPHLNQSEINQSEPSSSLLQLELEQSQPNPIGFQPEAPSATAEASVTTPESPSDIALKSETEPSSQPISSNSLDQVAQIDNLAQPTIQSKNQPKSLDLLSPVENLTQPTIQPKIEPSSTASSEPLASADAIAPVQPSIDAFSETEPLPQPISSNSSNQVAPIENLVQPTIQQPIQQSISPTSSVPLSPVENLTQPTIQPKIEPSSTAFTELPASLEAIAPVEPSVEPSLQPSVEPSVNASVQPFVDLSEDRINSPSVESFAEPQPSPIHPQLEHPAQPIQRTISEPQTLGSDPITESATARIPDGTGENPPTSQPSALPELPTVLQRLSVWEPLGQQQPISPSLNPLSSQPLQSSAPSIQRSPQPQRTSNPAIAQQPIGTNNSLGTDLFSTGWANIAELFQSPSESSFVSRAPETPEDSGYSDLNLSPDPNAASMNLIQREPDDDLSGWEPVVQKQSSEPFVNPMQRGDRNQDQPTSTNGNRETGVTSGRDLFSTGWDNIAELFQASSDTNSERQDFDTASDNHYPDLNLYPETNTPSNGSSTEQIQRQIEPSTSTGAPTSSATAAASASHHPDASSPQQSQASPEKLEQLAQEIYRLVKQRLALERERLGNIYSGRLR